MGLRKNYEPIFCCHKNWKVVVKWALTVTLNKKHWLQSLTIRHQSATVWNALRVNGFLWRLPFSTDICRRHSQQQKKSQIKRNGTNICVNMSCAVQFHVMLFENSRTQIHNDPPTVKSRHKIFYFRWAASDLSSYTVWNHNIIVLRHLHTLTHGFRSAIDYFPFGQQRKNKKVNCSISL